MHIVVYDTTGDLSGFDSDVAGLRTQGVLETYSRLSKNKNAKTAQGNGNYWVLITDANGCISDTAYYNVTFFPSALDNLLNDKTKRLNKIVDVLGTSKKPTANTPLFYIYDDGTVEKRIIIE